MGNIKYRELDISKMYWGDQEVSKIYYGNTLIYEAGGEAGGETCVVSGLGSSSPSSVSFTKSSGFTKAGLGIEEIIYNGDTFIKIPTMYRKINDISNGQITSYTISNVALDSDFQAYSCFYDSNNVLLPYILIGKYYNTSSNSCVSKSNTTPVSLDLNTGRTYAKNRGTGYQLYDWQIHRLWQDLITCFKESVNTNSGTAWTKDELGIIWNKTTSFLDGIMIGKSGYLWFCSNPNYYVGSSGDTSNMPSFYQAAWFRSPKSGEIMALSYYANNPFFNFPSSTTSNSSYDTYYCDQYNPVNDSTRDIGIEPGNAASSYGCYGMRLRLIGVVSSYAVRLCYRPL